MINYKMKKVSLIIALSFIGSYTLAQETTSFSLKQAQAYAIENNYKNKKAMLDVDIAKKESLGNYCRRAA